MFYSHIRKNRRLDLAYRYKVTTLVFLGTILGQLGIDLYTPSMPIMRIAFHTTSSYIQMSLTTYLFGYGALQILFGYTADRFGRRPTLLIGYAGFFVATLLILNTHNIVYFLLFRLLQGGSGAAFQVMIRAAIRDLFSGIELTKVSGYYSTAWALIPILAPALGGYIQHYFGWHMHFEVLLVICTLFFIITWLLLPETKPRSATTEADRFLSILYQYCKNLDLISFAIIAALNNLILFAYVTIAPFLLQDSFAISPIKFGWLVLSVTLFYMAGSLITGRFAEKLGSRKLIITTISLIILILLIMLILNTINNHVLYFILIPIAIMFFASGAFYPAIAGKAYTAIKNNAGIAVALYGTIYMATTAIGVGLTALLPHITILAFTYFALCLSILIILILFILRTKL